MLKAVLWTSLVVMMTWFTYQTIKHPQLAYNKPIDKLRHPFDTRVRYRIGQIDPRFGLSRSEIYQLTHEAVQIWHNGTGQKWFVYDDEAQLSINFIYDERQETTFVKQKTRMLIDKQVSDHNMQLETLAKQKQALKLTFESLESRLATWQATHNTAYYRLQHNQNPNDYLTLYYHYQQTLFDKKRLDDELASFYAKQRAYNEKVNQINLNAQRVQKSIDDAHIKFTSKKFHKGVFNGQQIEIYEFDSKDELRLVLAHELGHALSIDHNNDPTALMYPIMEQQNTKHFKLKPADIELLTKRNGSWQKHITHHHSD